MAIERHGDIWDDFNSQDYLTQNYFKLLPEDRRIIEEQANLVARLDIPAYSLEGEVLEVGCGGVFQYSAAQRLLADTGRMLYTEYSPNGLALTQSTLDDFHKTGQTGVWKKFGDYLLDVDPRYGVGPAGNPVHPTERALLLGHTVQESVYDLPVGRFQGAVSNFCLDSITDEEESWQLATERFVRSVKTGGFVVLTCMLDSTGYDIEAPDGQKTVFPAYAISPGGITDRLRELGVCGLRTAVIDDVLQGARPMTEDGGQFTHYSGMGVFAGIAA
jgi:hypothetical protein